MTAAERPASEAVSTGIMPGSANFTKEYASGGLRLCTLAPPPDLAPYVSAYYRTEVDEGVVVEDLLPPEEANLRCGKAQVYEAAIGAGDPAPVPPAVLSGPTDRGTRLRIGGGRFWGIGLTPAGWARFIRLPAANMANRFADIETCKVRQPLVRMLETLREDVARVDEAGDLITRTLRDLPCWPHPAEARIAAVHRHLVSEDAHAVADLADAAGMLPRTFVRFCQRHFGFSPSTLLRRQRFLRSLGRYMLDPSMRWVNSLDPQYWDQAQFIRDFRSTMQATPSEYAAMPHPIVKAAVAVTNAGTGVAMQALFHPDHRRESETGL